MTNSEKPRLALKTGRWFAAPATNKATAELSERFETGPNLPGYTLIRTAEIEALDPKLESIEGAGKVLTISTSTDKLDRLHGEITTAEIEWIGTGPVAKPTAEIVIPTPSLGKRRQRRIRAEMRRARVYGEEQRIAA